jgi:hypothetical protein
MAHEASCRGGSFIGLALVLTACSTLEPCPAPPVITYTGDKFLAFFASSDLALQPSATAAIKTAAERIKPDGRVRVVGHTDRVGDAEANLVLSYRRANLVGKALATAGVDPARISIEARGADQLLVNTPGAEPQNRRVEVIVTQFGTREPSTPRYREVPVACLSEYIRHVPIESGEK